MEKAKKWVRRLKLCNLCGACCFVCDYLRETFGDFFVCGLIEYACMIILSQIDWVLLRVFSRRLRWSRRGMQQAALLRRERQIVVSVVIKVCMGKSAGDIGVLLCGLIEYACVYSPADYADHAEECSKLHYCAEKDRLELVWLLRFVCVICGRIISIVQNF